MKSMELEMFYKGPTTATTMFLKFKMYIADDLEKAYSDGWQVREF